MSNSMWCVSTSPAKNSQFLHQQQRGQQQHPAADPYARVEDEYNAWLKDSPSTKKQPCKYFSFGGCTRGTDCPYSYDLTVEPKNDEDSTRGFVLLGGNVANLPGGGNQENHHSSHGGQKQFEQPQFDDQYQHQHRHQQFGEWDAPTGNVPPANYYGDDVSSQHGSSVSGGAGGDYQTRPAPRSWNSNGFGGSQQDEQQQYHFYPNSNAGSSRRQPSSIHQQQQSQARGRRSAHELRNMPTHEYAVHQQAEFVRRFQNYTNQRSDGGGSHNHNSGGGGGGAASLSQWELHQKQQQQQELHFQQQQLLQQQRQQQAPLAGMAVNGTSPQPTKRRMPGQIAYSGCVEGVNPSASLFQPGGRASSSYPNGKNPTAMPFQPSGGGGAMMAAEDDMSLLTGADVESQYNEAVNNFGYRRQQAMRAPLNMETRPQYPSSHQGSETAASTGSRTPPAEVAPFEASTRRRPPQLNSGTLANGTSAEQHQLQKGVGTPFSAKNADSPSSFASIASPMTAPGTIGHVAAGSPVGSATSAGTSSPVLGAAQLRALEHRKLRNSPITEGTSPWTGAPLAAAL